MRAAASVVLLALCMHQAQAWSLWGSDEVAEEAKEDKPQEAPQVSEEDYSKVVGARIETCRQCRLNSLPRVRRFIEDQLPKYKTLSVVYIHGANPDILWLNRFGQEVDRNDLGEYPNEDAIKKLLKKKGLTKDTPAFAYEEPKFDATAVCEKFLARQNCDIGGARVTGMDRHCKVELGPRSAGHCQCNGGLEIPVRCGSRDMKLTCQALCEEVESSDPRVVYPNY
eukprot:TRINITY_DN3277_c0_g1_i2.p1 TRINITY_DN3277_c0_g1~~TRINITY_DN3277_c0_g1_i2.p1  ORF type:complete len:225 (+),score=105.39 TRINITY_DN3277_c0_g1_i2:75-749(+)